MKRFGALTILAIAALWLWLPAGATAATYTKVVRYGPYTIPAGTASTPGMVHNKLSLAVPRPCLDCYITSFTPDLVYADGTPATMDMGAMLHHFVLTSQFNRDATCGNSWLGLAGERFFASGDERTAIIFEPGYGYRVRWFDSWNLLVDLMNHSSSATTVYVQVTYSYRPPWESVNRLKPVWLDIEQCGDSEYSIPGGVLAHNTWDWSVNVPGKVIAGLGHVHGHGIAVEATNESQGTSICRSTATLHPTDVHRVLDMTTCSGDPVAVIQQGETVRLHSWYSSSHPADDVMGIMLLYVHPT
jgi:Stress up-regulated Nod 19